MGFADVWARTLVYFGIAEEEDWDEDGYLTEEELADAYEERPNVRRLPPRRSRQSYDDDWTDPEPAPTAADEHPPPARPSRGRRRSVEAVPGPGGGRASTSSCRAASTTPSRSPTASRTACR